MKTRHSAMLLALAFTAAAGQAQDYPTRPVRVIVPYAPGGGSDILARMLAPRAAADLGQQFVVDNRAGGNSMIGTGLIAKSTPDGYTIGMIDTAFTINPGLFAKMPYDATRDFAPVTLVASSPLILVVHPSVAAQSAKELVALAKAKPGQVTFGSAGNGTAIHLALEQFRLVAGVELVHVPYKGGGPLVADLVAGQVNMTIGTPASLLQFIRANRARALATTAKKRLVQLPDVPTFTEVGMPGVDAGPYWGLVAPAGTPAAVVQRLNAVMVKHIRAPDLRERMAELSFDPVGNAPEEFVAFVRGDLARWGKIIKDSGAKAE